MIIISCTICRIAYHCIGYASHASGRRFRIVTPNNTEQYALFNYAQSRWCNCEFGIHSTSNVCRDCIYAKRNKRYPSCINTWLEVVYENLLKHFCHGVLELRNVAVNYSPDWNFEIWKQKLAQRVKSDEHSQLKPTTRASIFGSNVQKALPWTLHSQRFLALSTFFGRNLSLSLMLYLPSGILLIPLKNFCTW